MKLYSNHLECALRIIEGMKLNSNSEQRIPYSTTLTIQAPHPTSPYNKFMIPDEAIQVLFRLDIQISGRDIWVGLGKVVSL